MFELKFYLIAENNNIIIYGINYFDCILTVFNGHETYTRAVYVFFNGVMHLKI